MSCITNYYEEKERWSISLCGGEATQNYFTRRVLFGLLGGGQTQQRQLEHKKSAVFELELPAPLMSRSQHGNRNKHVSEYYTDVDRNTTNVFVKTRYRPAAVRRSYAIAC